MKNKFFVRSIAVALVLVYALGLCVFAEEIPVVDYRMDVKQINPQIKEEVKKPIANFIATVKTPTGDIRDSMSPYTGTDLAYDAYGTVLDLSLIYKITAYVGDTIEFRDDSKPISGQNIVGCDFQWYSNQTSGQIYVSKEEFNNTKFTFTQPGTWRL